MLIELYYASRRVIRISLLWLTFFLWEKFKSEEYWPEERSGLQYTYFTPRNPRASTFWKVSTAAFPQNQG